MAGRETSFFYKTLDKKRLLYALTAIERLVDICCSSNHFDLKPLGKFIKYYSLQRKDSLFNFIK